MELARESKRETNGANCANAHLDDCAVHGQLSSSGIRGTRLVDTKVYIMQACAMVPGQRILKVHGDNQQVADCLAKIMTPRAAYRKALGL